MQEIVIGTANFGEKYGVLKNKISNLNTNSFRFFLKKHKLKYFDCALNYKYNQKNLEFLKKSNLKIISKIKLPEKKKIYFLKNIKNFLHENLELLKKDKYELMLLHNVKDLYDKKGLIMLEKLFELKKKK